MSEPVDIEQLIESGAVDDETAEQWLSGYIDEEEVRSRIEQSGDLYEQGY
jgi:hypothetical protein